MTSTTLHCNNNNILAVDLGSGITKATANTSPQTFTNFYSLVGKARHAIVPFGDKLKEYVGSEASQRRGILLLKYPIEHGYISHVEDACKLIDLAATETKFIVTNSDNAQQQQQQQLKNRTLILSEKVATSEAMQAKIINGAMQTLPYIDQVSMVPSPILALLGEYLQGKNKRNINNILTGTVIESGDGITHISTVKNGLIEGFSSMSLAGRDITNQMSTLLGERGYGFITTAERILVGDMKEKHCYVALDFDNEMCKFATSSDYEVNYELPDGNYINLHNELVRTTEPLFQPNFMGYSSLGLHELVYNTIMKSESAATRQELLENIILVGGNMSFKGMEQRLEKELKNLVSNQLARHINIHTNLDQHLNVKGAMALANSPYFQEFLVTRQQVSEEGPEKCVAKLMSCVAINKENAHSDESENARMRRKVCRTALALAAIISQVPRIGAHMHLNSKHTNVTIQFS